MIDRYSLTASTDVIRERFAADVLNRIDPKYNAAPTHLLPVITQSAPQGVSTYYWGTSPAWAKNKTVSEKLINVRAEQIPDKASFKKALARKRCIVPADGFFAWKKAGKKTMIPYRFVTRNQQVFSFAGLWDEYEDTDGNEFHTFMIITVPANELVSSVCERMPVILDPSTEAIWLNGNSSEDELLSLLKSYPSSDVSLYPVSSRILNTEANLPSLITPTPPADQFGNLTLFD